jgi:hypothetical protein
MTSAGPSQFSERRDSNAMIPTPLASHCFEVKMELETYWLFAAVKPICSAVVRIGKYPAQRNFALVASKHLGDFSMYGWTIAERFVVGVQP